MAEKILLIGHDKKHGIPLVNALISFGFQPTVDDWASFLPRKHKHQKPSAVIADMDNPDAKPLEQFVPALKKYWGESFPLIAMSNSRKFQHCCAFVDAGAEDCIPKAIPDGLLERKIRHCLEKRTTPSVSELCEEMPGHLLGVFRQNPQITTLGQLATIYGGATPRRPWGRRMAPPDEAWRGVITSDAVDRFFTGRPSGYLLWSRQHLFRVPAAEEYSVQEKVFLSRSAPPLRAAVDKSRLPAGADVYSLVPREGAGAGWLACILNSRIMDFYFNRLARNDDGRLRLEILRATPMPKPTPASVQELGRHATMLSHFGPNPQSWIDRQSKEEIWERMENAVFDLFGASQAVREDLTALHF